MPNNQGNWLAIQTFHAQELKVSRFLDSHQTKHFIPMVTKRTVTKDGKGAFKRIPAVHNLIFLQIDRNMDEMRSVLSDCPYPISVYSRFDAPGKWCMIPDSDMVDLRMICDINFTEPLFVSAKECEMKVGAIVRVTHGPMKNMKGKLVRKNKKYYLVRTFCDLGVMVSVSRWCCEPVADKEEK